MKNIGDDGAQAAFDKPFSHFTCSKNLVDLGIITALLPPPPARLLDIGCGTGWTSAFFARRGYRVTGQDIAPDMLQYAERNRARYEATDLDFVLSDYESLNFTEPFDCAVFYDSLHHAVDERAALQSVFRALRPGGILITHEPGAGHSKSPDSLRAMELRCDREGHAARHTVMCPAKSDLGIPVLPDPTLAIISMYGINLAGATCVHQPWWRRLLKLARLFADKTLQHGGLCVITK